MRAFFSRKKQEEKVKPVDLPSAILKNKEAINVLEKRQEHLEKRIAVLDEQVRATVARGTSDKAAKTRAIQLLKSKAMLVGQLQQVGDARLTLEQQIIQLESAQAQQVAVGALAAGVNAQKALSSKMNVTNIDRLMEDMQEQQELQNEVAQVLSQGTPLMDETDLLAELGQIEAEELDKKLADVQPVPTGVPGISVPIVAPVTATADPILSELQRYEQQHAISASSTATGPLGQQPISSSAAHSRLSTPVAALRVGASPLSNSTQAQAALPRQQQQRPLTDEEQLRLLQANLA